MLPVITITVKPASVHGSSRDDLGDGHVAQ
jgi:hypothetical protein